jgi:hypothetical protein
MCSTSREAMTASAAQQEFEDVDGQDPDGQYPERLDRVVRNDPVVHVHRVDGPDQPEQVDGDGGHRDMAVDRPQIPDRAPEPVPVSRHGRMAGAQVRTVAHPQEQDRAGEGLLQFRDRQGPGAAAAFRQQDFRVAPCQPHQHAGMTACKLQHAGQVERRNVGDQASSCRARLQPGAIGGAQEQRRRRLLGMERQPRTQCLDADRPAQQRGGDGEASEQRIVVARIGGPARRALGGGGAGFAAAGVGKLRFGGLDHARRHHESRAGLRRRPGPMGDP